MKKLITALVLVASATGAIANDYNGPYVPTQTEVQEGQHKYDHGWTKKAWDESFWKSYYWLNNRYSKDFPRPGIEKRYRQETAQVSCGPFGRYTCNQRVSQEWAARGDRDAYIKAVSNYGVFLHVFQGYSARQAGKQVLHITEEFKRKGCEYDETWVYSPAQNTYGTITDYNCMTEMLGDYSYHRNRLKSGY